MDQAASKGVGSMALKGLTLAETFDFQFDDDPGKGTPDATTFKLRTLDVTVTSHINDNSLSFEGETGTPSIKINQSHVERVRFGLCGWDNFQDQDGNHIDFRTVKRNLGGRSYEVAADECLNRLGMERIRELSEAIQKRNRVTRDEEKKSDAV
jgi:hypothetical protein